MRKSFSHNKIFRLTITLVLALQMFSVSAIAGSSVDKENCCHTVIKETSCCEVEEVEMKCEMNMDMNASFSHCGCSHEQTNGNNEYLLVKPSENNKQFVSAIISFIDQADILSNNNSVNSKIEIVYSPPSLQEVYSVYII